MLRTDTKEREATLAVSIECEVVGGQAKGGHRRVHW
jgi:hypothetical protein